MESLLRAREEKLRGELRADDLIEKNRSRSVERLREAYGDMLLRYNAEHSGDRPRQEMADALTSAANELFALLPAPYIPTARRGGSGWAGCSPCWRPRCAPWRPCC